MEFDIILFYLLNNLHLHRNQDTFSIPTDLFSTSGQLSSTVIFSILCSLSFFVFQFNNNWFGDTVTVSHFTKYTTN